MWLGRCVCGWVGGWDGEGAVWMCAYVEGGSVYMDIVVVVKR